MNRELGKSNALLHPDSLFLLLHFQHKGTHIGVGRQGLVDAVVQLQELCLQSNRVKRKSIVSFFISTLYSNDVNTM